VALVLAAAQLAVAVLPVDFPPVAKRRALSQELPALSRLAAEWLAAGFVAQAQQRVWVSGQLYSVRSSSRELPADFPLALAQSLWRVYWIQLWLIAAQLAAREQLQEQRLARTLLV
jgi:hypothetical protein